jgi:hypothetical protein
MSLWTRLIDLLKVGNTEAPREALSTTFPCAACDGVAATVHYLPKGEMHPHSGFPSKGNDRLMVQGFLGQLEEVIPKGSMKVWTAVQQADPAALWKIHPLWAPFYCSDCGKSYCQAHWTTQTHFDDDYRGWYDYTSGRCPEGHERILDD